MIMDKRCWVARVRGCGGFTLLELLVALSIFAIVAMLAYGGLDSVLEQRLQTEESAERLAVLQKTYLIIQRDIEQLVPRSVRSKFGDKRAAIAGAEHLNLTRGGWSNPLNNPRSSLQRVGYTVYERRLIRYSWLVLDSAQDSEPRKQVLATQLTGLRVRYLDQNDHWQQQWPAEKSTGGEPSDELPRAVEMTLEHEHYGEIRWLFQLPA
jgi:general secretion pathway protein J